MRNITKNKIIMDYAIDYVNKRNLLKKILASINHMRLYKEMILLCELVRIEGSCKTLEFRNINDKSCIKWKIKFPKLPKPSKKSLQYWIDFIEWLYRQNTVTTYDFEEKINCRY